MAKAVVTGGAGFIGSHLVEQLLEEGIEVSVIDNFSTGKRKNLEHVLPKIELVEGSIVDREKVDKAMQNADFVFHEAAKLSVEESLSNPEAYHKVNVDGMRNVLESAVENKVKKFIFASTSAAYKDIGKDIVTEETETESLNPYSTTKLEGEKLCREFEKKGLETVIFRYFNVFGPRQDAEGGYASVVPVFISRMLRGETPVIFGSGEQTRDFVFVEDVARANIAAMKTGSRALSQVFNIASGESVSINQLFEKISRLLGKDTEPVHGKQREGEIFNSFASAEKAREMLGFEPSCSLEQGLKKTIEWFKEE